MFNPRTLARIDLRVIPVIAALMVISLLVISSMTGVEDEIVWTPHVKSQLRWFCMGWGLFAFFAGLDYRRFKDWSPVLYALTLILLVGLFFAPAIQNVHRWYRVPGLGMAVQPSEFAKLSLMLMVAWFVERKGSAIESWGAAFQLGLLVGIPFLLILKQPDLGTALILYPIGLAMAYIAGVRTAAVRIAGWLGISMLIAASSIFLGLFSHEEMRPVFTKVMREYQYERLNPDTYHQRAAKAAIALGGVGGTGWRKSEFSAHKWLPASHTDSVFASYAEEFGLVGVGILLSLFYGLIYLGFQVVRAAQDPFGRVLATGLSTYLAMHVLVNSAMMCGLLPLSGVPLLFLTYGGSSQLAAMAALGMLQSIYSRRFMF